MSESPEIPHTLAAVARPGDTIFLGLGYAVCDEELTEFLANFENFTETTGIHVAVAEGVTSMVVARPDDENINDWGDDVEP